MDIDKPLDEVCRFPPEPITNVSNHPSLLPHSSGDTFLLRVCTQANIRLDDQGQASTT